MVIEIVTPSVRLVADALMEPVPTVVVTDRSFHDATPAATVFVRVEPVAKVPQVAPVFLANVTDAVELSVHRVPELFCTSTMTVPRVDPRVALLGWAVKTKVVAPQSIA